LNERKTRIDVLATPNARCNKVGGTHDGALKVRVVEVAEKGRANQAVLVALADALGVRESQVKLVGGASSRRKVFEVSEESAVLSPIVKRLLSE
jgi:uncharacterized protein